MSSTVLVIEDYGLLRGTMRDCLHFLGCNVYEARDGREGLALLRARARDVRLVLLDLEMPVMDGWEFLRRKALDPMIAPVPVIVVSGSVSATRLEHPLPVLIKPVRLEVLAKAVSEHAHPPSTDDDAAATSTELPELLGELHVDDATFVTVRRMRTGPMATETPDDFGRLGYSATSETVQPADHTRRRLAVDSKRRARRRFDLAVTAARRGRAHARPRKRACGATCQIAVRRGE